MKTTNGKQRMDLTTPQQHSPPAVLQPAVPVPAMILAQLAPLIVVDEVELLKQLKEICPETVAGEVFFEQEFSWYEED